MYAFNSVQPWLAWLFVPLLMMNFLHAANAQPHPVRVWGDIRSVYRTQDFAEDNVNASSWLNIGTIHASSYLWQPWFALVDGSLSMSTNEAESDLTPKSESQGVTGSFRLNMFPTSRFPFLFYARKTQNEQENQLSNRTSTQTTVGMNQQYNSRDGKQSYVGQIEHVESDTIDNNKLTNDSIDFAATFQLEENSFSGDLSYDNNTDNNENDETDFTLAARHSYFGTESMSLENRVALSRIKENFSTSTIDTKNNQFSSFVLWNPAERSDMNLTGNFRIAEQEQLFTQNQSDTLGNNRLFPKQTTVNINQGFIYNISPSTSLRQSANANQTDTGTSERFSGSETVGLTYSPESIDTSLGVYGWNAGANVSHQHGDDTESTFALGTQLSHTLSKDFLPYPDVQIRTTATQALAHSKVEGNEANGTLGHSLSLGWDGAKNDHKYSVRVTGSDTRSLGEDENELQLFNLQGTSQVRHSRNIFFSGEATLQYSRSSSVFGSSGTRLVRAQFSYSDTRFMKVHGLWFRSELILSEQEPTNARDFLSDDDDANSVSWGNDLIYRIGLFESRLSLDYIKSDSKYDRIIIIQLTRNFGDI